MKHSHSLEFYGANPSIEVSGTGNGYRVTAVRSRSVGASLGSLLLLLLCLACLGIGVVVWFLPDDVFDGDPRMLKSIVTGATWTVFAPLVYFNFLNTTTMATEVDLAGRMLHQLYLNGRGEETKRRSIAFSEVDDLELLTNDNGAPDEQTTIATDYGQIYLRLSARKGLSLVWGHLSDLKGIWSQMRQDILASSR